MEFLLTYLPFLVVNIFIVAVIISLGIWAYRLWLLLNGLINAADALVRIANVIENKYGKVAKEAEDE